MEKQSCKNCRNINLEKKEEQEGRLKGKYRYGCREQKSGFICGFLSDDEKLMNMACKKWKRGKPEQNNDPELANRYEKKLQYLFDCWKLWNEKGCPETEFPDGIYLNHLRDDMVSTRGRIEEDLPESEYPECYFSPLPPITEEDHMPACEVLREEALRALQEYTQNADYQWLVKTAPALQNNERIGSEVYRLLCHVDILKQAIQEENYLLMKRESRQEHFYEDLILCRKLVEKSLTNHKKIKRTGKNEDQIIGQMDIFNAKAS